MNSRLDAVLTGDLSETELCQIILLPLAGCLQTSVHAGIRLQPMLCMMSRRALMCARLFTSVLFQLTANVALTKKDDTGASDLPLLCHVCQVKPNVKVCHVRTKTYGGM